jgi:WD40 repeat protein
MAQPNYCPECGEAVLPEDRFCAACGWTVADAAPTPSAAAVPPPGVAPHPPATPAPPVFRPPAAAPPWAAAPPPDEVPPPATPPPSAIPLPAFAAAQPERKYRLWILLAVAAVAVLAASGLWSSFSAHSNRNAEEYPTALAFNEDDSLLAGACPPGIIKIWKTADGRLQETWQSGPGAMAALAFRSDRSQLVAVSWKKVVTWWSLTVHGALAAFTLPVDFELKHAAFLAGGKRLALMGENRLVIFDLDSLQAVESVDTGPESPLGISADGDLLAFGLKDGLLKIVSRDGSWGQQFPPSGEFERPYKVVFRPARKGAAVAEARKAYTLDFEAGAARPLSGPELDVISLAFSPSGSRLAGGGLIFPAAKWRIGIWDAATGSLLRTIDAPRWPF